MRTKKNELISRTEEIQDIVDRMPTNFGYYISVFILVLFSIIVGFGFAIKYPQVISGEVTINAESSPIKLVSKASGNITDIFYNSGQNVNPGDYIAVLENSAKVTDIKKISKIIMEVDQKSPANLSHIAFPENVSLGELNLEYFNFLATLNEYLEFNTSNTYDKQREILVKTLEEQKKQIENFNGKLEIGSKNVVLMQKFLKRDSILFSKKVLTEAEHDRSEMNFISVKDGYLTNLKDVSLKRSEIEDTKNKIEQNQLQKTQKGHQLHLDLISKFTDLSDAFKSWESKYVFKSPIKGRVQYLKFLNRNQFLQNGDAVVSIIPTEDKLIGQMTLPASGSGKVKVGQRVIVKLEGYPFREYGSIPGSVTSISLTSNIKSTQNGNVDNYLVTIQLPKKLRTNFGVVLPFKYELRGIAEIITKDRMLIERLFDNLKYDTTEK